MGKHYTIEFKQKVIDEYKSGNFGGYPQLAKRYGLSPGTVWHWIEKNHKQGNQINDINNSRGRKSVKNIDYKERYEILKKYQAFLKAQRERK